MPERDLGLVPDFGQPVEGESGELPLSPAEHRLHLVSTVERWMPLEVDRDALRLDLAIALIGAGRLSEAASIVQERGVRAKLLVLANEALGSGRLDSRVELNRARALTHALLDDFLLVSDFASSGAVSDAELRELTDDLHLESELSRREGIGALEVQLSKLIEARPGLTTRGVAPARISRSRIDLQLVSPRVFAWSNPDESEIEIIHGDGVLEVSVALAVGAVPDQSYFAFVADPAGRLVTEAALRTSSDGRRLSAEMPMEDTAAEFTVGVRESRVSAELAASRAVSPLVDAQRLLVASWSRSRLQLSGAVIDQVVPDLVGARWLDRSPKLEAESAEHLLAPSAVAGSSEAHAYRTRVIEPYLRTTSWDLSTAGPVSGRPLIAEIVFVLDRVLPAVSSATARE